MIFRFGRLVALANLAGEASTAGAGSPPGTPPAGGNAGGDASAAGAAPSAGAANGGGATGGQPSVKTFTQEEVNRIAAQAREDGRRTASKAPDAPDAKAGGQQQAAAGAQVPDVTSVVQQAVAQALQLAGVDPFTVAARSAGYSDAQVQLARAAHEAARPPDTAKWLAEWPTQVGMQIKVQSNGTGAPTPTASNGGPPRKVEDMRDDAGLIDVFSLTPDQVMAMGPAKIREEFEKVETRRRDLSGAPPLPSVLRRK